MDKILVYGVQIKYVAGLLLCVNVVNTESEIEFIFQFYYREIFERSINLKVSVKKIKCLFKKYLQFEEQYGTPSSVESIKDKARAFVETKVLTDKQN